MTEIDIFYHDIDNKKYYANINYNNGTRSPVILTEDQFNAYNPSFVYDFSTDSSAVYVLKSYNTSTFTGYVTSSYGKGYGFDLSGIMTLDIMLKVNEIGIATVTDETGQIELAILKNNNQQGTLNNVHVDAGSASSESDAINYAKMEGMIPTGSIILYAQRDSNFVVSNPFSGNPNEEYGYTVFFVEPDVVTPNPIQDNTSPVPYTIFQPNQQPIDVTTNNPTQLSSIVNTNLVAGNTITQSNIISTKSSDPGLPIESLLDGTDLPATSQTVTPPVTNPPVTNPPVTNPSSTSINLSSILSNSTILVGISLLIIFLVLRPKQTERIIYVH